MQRQARRVLLFARTLRGHLVLGLCGGLMSALTYTAIQQTPTFGSTLLWFVVVTLGLTLGSRLCTL
jgi:hypothetical protein